MAGAFDRELQVAIRAVTEAASLCRDVQAGITADVLAKKDRSPVTVADFGSQALICRTLHDAFADDPVIAEEDSAELQKPENHELLSRVLQHVSKHCPNVNEPEICNWIDHGRTRVYKPRFWTLDPIDGTKGFLRGEQYAVSLALIVNGRIEVAILGCPNLPVSPNEGTALGVIFYAVRGQGAWSKPIVGEDTPRRVQVSPRSDPTLAQFCESVESGHSSHDRAAVIAGNLGLTQPPVRMDSQAKYAVVARGVAEIYLRLPTRVDYQEKIWDHAGGVLIVTEAGGTVTDIAGKPLEFTHGSELIANRGVIATNGPLHARVLTEIQALGLR